MEIFEQQFTVELSDITTSFGLKSIAVLKYYQETFARYCAKYNVAGYDVYKMGLKWVFGQSVVEFSDTIPIWNEKVTAKVYIANVKKLRIYINFEISTERGIVATGQSVAYILDLVNSRPQPVESIINHFKLNTTQLNNEILKPEFEKDGKLISQTTHTITFSDLDYNGHTNNISYVALGFEGLQQEFLKENFPKTIDIKYLQETFLNDTLKCEISKDTKNNTFEHIITNARDNSLVCIINSIWQKRNMTPQEFFNILEKTNKNLTCIS